MKFFKLSQFQSPEIKKYVQEYSALCVDSNIRVIRMISSILLGFHVLMLIVDYFLYQSGQWISIPAYEYLFYAHIAVYIIFIPAFFLSKKQDRPRRKYQNIISQIFIYLTIVWSTAVSLIDQYIHHNITVVMMCSLIVATTIIFSFKERIFAFAFALLLFIVGFLMIDNDSAVKIGNIVNGSVFIFFSFMISALIGKYHFNNFLSKKLIEEQNNKLKNYNEDLKQFSYIVSHDLKAPLRTISNFTSLLDRSITDKTERQESFMGFIKGSANNMSQLIDDLLTFTALEKNQGTEILSLDEIIGIVKNNLSAEILESNAIIEHPIKFPSVKGIKPHMILLFQNLIQNAIKYHSEAKPIIHIAFLQRKNEIEFVIKDNGVGIDKSVNEGIFNLFSRGEQNKSEFKGTGIGLAICKKIIQHLNGEIWVVSEKGDGSSFFFTIPT